MTKHVPVIKPITTHPTSSKSMMIHSSFVPVNSNPPGPHSIHSQIQSKSVAIPSTCITMLNNSTATTSMSTNHFTMQTKSSLEFKKVMDKANEEDYNNKQLYNKVTITKHGHADEKSYSKEKSFEILEVKDKTRPVFLKQKLPSSTKNKNATIKWSSLCLNVVICPFCKTANWGHKQYQEHLKTYHSAQEIHSNVLKKAVNYMNYKLEKNRIPRTPKYKNMQIPPRMIYNYKNHVFSKTKFTNEGQNNFMVNPLQSPTYLRPYTPLEPLKNKVLKQGDIIPITKPISSIEDIIKDELIKSPKLFKNTKNFVSKIATKQANLVTQKLPDMPELIPLQRSKTTRTTSNFRLIRPWEDSIPCFCRYCIATHGSLDPTPATVPATTSKASNKKPNLDCYSCGRTFKRRYCLSRHYKDFHEKDKINEFECYICAFPDITSKKQQNIHLQTHREPRSVRKAKKSQIQEPKVFFT